MNNLFKTVYANKQLKTGSEDTHGVQISVKHDKTRMWANAQRDGRPAEHRWRPLFNAANFG